MSEFELSVDFDSLSAEQINRAEPEFGDHLVQIMNARRFVSRKKVPTFLVDLKVLEGPSGEGFECCYVWQPDSNEDYKKKREAELKRATGACYGHDATDSTTAITLAVLNETFVDTTTDKTARSPLRGRIVRMSAEIIRDKTGKPVPTKKQGRGRPVAGLEGRYTPKIELRPYTENGQPVSRPIAVIAAPQAAPASIAPPPAPAVQAVSAPAFPPPGWAPHTNPEYAAQGWYYDTRNPSATPVHERDLRKAS